MCLFLLVNSAFTLFFFHRTSHSTVRICLMQKKERVQTLEDGRVPAKEAKNWRIEGQKKRITRKEYQRLVNKFDKEGLMAQKRLWNLAKEKIMKERGELLDEEGDAVREFQAMHEQHFWSNWLREDERGKEEKVAKTVKNEKEKKKGKEEKVENATGTVKRRCEGFVSVEAFKIFGQWRDLESCGDLSWEDLLDKRENLSDREPYSRARVRLVTDVPVSPSSVVTEPCDLSSGCLDWEVVEPQSFSSSKKRVWTATQEEMRHEDSPVKAPPPSRRRMTPPTPLQNSYSSLEWEQEHFEVENQIWRAREKAPWRQNSSSSSNERQWPVGMEEQRGAWSSSERKVMRAVETRKAALKNKWMLGYWSV